MEELCNMGFLNEVKEKKGGYFQYRYTLTENGRNFLGENDHMDIPNLKDCLIDMNESKCQIS